MSEMPKLPNRFHAKLTQQNKIPLILSIVQIKSQKPVRLYFLHFLEKKFKCYLILLKLAHFLKAITLCRPFQNHQD